MLCFCNIIFIIILIHAFHTGHFTGTQYNNKNFSCNFLHLDLHLIFNLVSGSTSFHTAESWTPICLPRFDNSGYLYAHVSYLQDDCPACLYDTCAYKYPHVSYLQDDCPACLLLLSTDRNAFFELSECKVKILEVNMIQPIRFFNVYLTAQKYGYQNRKILTIIPVT